LDQTQDAVTMLYSPPNLETPHKDSESTSTQFLVAQAAYLDGLKQSLSADIAALHAELSALLTYFHFDHSLERAVADYRQLENAVTSASPFALEYKEIIHQYRTKLIRFHLENVTTHKPAKISAMLKESITLFPGNTELLVAFAYHSRKFGLDDRLRNLFITGRDPSEEEPQLAQWRTDIWMESCRDSDAGGTIHGMRALFEHAVESNR
jgi:hypothetical protein